MRRGQASAWSTRYEERPECLVECLVGSRPGRPRPGHVEPTAARLCLVARTRRTCSAGPPSARRARRGNSMRSLWRVQAGGIAVVVGRVVVVVVAVVAVVALVAVAVAVRVALALPLALRPAATRQLSCIGGQYERRMRPQHRGVPSMPPPRAAVPHRVPPPKPSQAFPPRRCLWCRRDRRSAGRGGGTTADAGFSEPRRAVSLRSLFANMHSVEINVFKTF